jgi:nicotinamide mononucleotide transporter
LLALESIAVALGLANQWLTIRQNILCWPIGIASVVLLAFVFFDSKLYSDVMLQGVYVALQAYGWVNWSRARAKTHADSALALRSTLPVRRLTARGWAVAIAATAAGGLALGTAMGRLTDAALPYWDATTTVLSLVAQLLQARKVLESWLLFLAANVSFIAIYVSKGLYPTTLLFLVISVLAAYGFVQWRQSYRAQGAASE